MRASTLRSPIVYCSGNRRIPDFSDPGWKLRYCDPNGDWQTEDWPITWRTDGWGMVFHFPDTWPEQ